MIARPYDGRGRARDRKAQVGSIENRIAANANKKSGEEFLNGRRLLLLVDKSSQSETNQPWNSAQKKENGENVTVFQSRKLNSIYTHSSIPVK